MTLIEEPATAPFPDFDINALSAPEPMPLAEALAMCLSAGLPEPEEVLEGYKFSHYRAPGLSFYVSAGNLQTYPDRVIQACQNANIRSNPVPPPAEPEEPPPPPPVFE